MIRTETNRLPMKVGFEVSWMERKYRTGLMITLNTLTIIIKHMRPAMTSAAVLS